MFNPFTVITIFLLYVGCLFIVALWAERKSARGRSPVNNAVVYSLSLAVYCTSWTFYGSVGKAATSGMLFITMYLGPTLAILLWWTVLRKLVRIKARHRITSIADLISARYNKSQSLAAIATFLALVGIMPYIALQLKAILSTFAVITIPSGQVMPWVKGQVHFIVVGSMIVFTIIFGVRRLAPTERHEGMVMALTVECLVKLTAFLAVGIFVTYFVYDGFGDIFRRLAESPFRKLAEIGVKETPPYLMWTSYMILAMSAVLFLPRQFHIAVVENSDEKHIRTALWLFPLYMFLINIFVFPIAAGGLLKGYPVQEADTFVLALPLRYGKPWLTMLVFIGGVSAATGMIMISAMTLSTMITNHLLLPLVGWVKWLSFLRRHLLKTRWVAVAVVLLLGYWFEQQVGESYMLVSIGMISFAAVLQFAPVVLGGIFWRRANKAGAILGLSAGSLIWFYTLLLPSFFKSHWISGSLLETGPWGMSFLKPEQLFGLAGFDPMSHALFWTMFFNIGLYVLGSFCFRQSEAEQDLAEAFVSVIEAAPTLSRPVKKEAFIDLKDKEREIKGLLRQYLGSAEAEVTTEECIKAVKVDDKGRISINELVELHGELEKRLAGSIGSAAARVAMKKGVVYSAKETRELSEYYSKILADVSVSPDELKTKIDYYRDREALLTSHAGELKRKVKERDEQIVERKRAEEALRQSEEKYRTILESIEEGYFEVDLSGNMTFVNNSLCRITGYSREELMSLNNREYTTAETAKKMYRVFNETYRTGNPAEVADFEVIIKNGKKKVLELSASLMSDQADNPIGFRGVVRDVTETKKLQAQLQHAQKMESIGTIASGVAHNFRNILAGISLNNQLIEMRHMSNIPLIEISRRIRDAVTRGAGLVDGLMQFSYKKGTRDLMTLNLADEIREIYDLIGKSFDKKIDIQMDLPETIPVMGDHSGLGQVMMNMCTNARDAMPEGGVLRVEARNEGDNALVIISDTGQGMDKEAQERCFDPFYTSKDVDKGTGLGLSTSYGIIKDHGGDIHVYSEPELGTTFKIYLPMVPQKEARAKVIDPKVVHGRGQKVLIVDDDDEMVKPMDEMLKGLGYLIRSVASGKEALSEYESWRPDAVLLDRNMPEMDGIICAKKIIEHDPAAKIILISGYEEKGPNGIDSRTKQIIKGYLTKPIDMVELSLVLGQLFK